MAPVMKFEIWRTWLTLQWRWRLRAANGEIIASGEGYRNKADCLHAINLVRSCAGSPAIEV